MAQKNQYKVHYPQLDYCIDNGAMIALAGLYRLKKGDFDQSYEIIVKPRSSLIDL